MGIATETHVAANLSIVVGLDFTDADGRAF